MVDVRVQKAYNWCYGRLVSSLWALNGVQDAVSKQSEEQLFTSDMDEMLQLHWKIVKDFLPSTAEQFQRLYRLEGAKCLEQAASRTREAASQWALALEQFKARDLDGTRKALTRAREELSIAKETLHRESPIRYRLWLLNPWRYYPKALE